LPKKKKTWLDNEHYIFEGSDRIYDVKPAKKKKTKTEKVDSFNWKGIRDNKDGTFDVSDKWAKSRLQKEFRKQGIRTRSKKTGQGGFMVYPVGQRKTRARGMGRLPKKEKQYYPGYKPRTRMTVAGPRPQLSPGRPGARPTMHPAYFGSRPTFRRRGGIGQGIIRGAQKLQASADKRAQRLQAEQRSPYLPDGTPRPGYQTYTDKTGTKRIVKMPTGGFRERFASKATKEGWHQARVAESRKVEAEMAERSKGQPSTRIPEHGYVPGTTRVARTGEREVFPQARNKPAPARVRRTTQLPRHHPADTEEGSRRTITSSGVRKTTELPEHKPDYQKMQHERAEAMERFSKIKLGEE
jgi:hypothetical protein